MSLPTPATALTALLNTLHSHLQSQTQLLPTLHAQLGLPESTLEDELRILQQQLIHGVEAQVNKRRKEVEQWVEKCNEIENRCVRYTKALGGNIKATGTSLGELRKESALPKRYELISEYQEKLRQVYHTKLEQLTALSNRLNVLARTLGPEYFGGDILDLTPAPGETTCDAGANRDVTPERFLKLEKELVHGKAEVNKRLQQLSTIFFQIDWLYGELGMSPPALDDLPGSPFGASATNSHSLSDSVASSSATMVNDPFLVSTPTPTSRSGASSLSLSSMLLFRSQKDSTISLDHEYQQIFANFLTRIEAEELDAENPQTVPRALAGVEPVPALLSWANSIQSGLEDIKRRREAHIQAMYDQLEGLWRRLGVRDEDMDVFVEEHRGSTEETVKQYEAELERMLELKRERMGAFVGSAREEIERLWNELMVGEDERLEFGAFVDDEFTEELLTIHEDEIKRLKDDRRRKAPLLAAIKKYFEICEEEKELAASAADQTRLTGRGSRDPGRLLREEKMRKRVSKEKPRLEQDLLVSIPAWEEEAGRPFLVHGASFMQILTEMVGTADQENQNLGNKRKAPPRAGSVPARATTPVGSSHGFAPGSKTGIVTPAVRSSSQTDHGSQSVPNKRQRLGGDSAATGVRAPLASYRNNNNSGGQRASSPTKIPTSMVKSVPRPASTGSHSTLAMVVPKPGTQHHALGHGRMPTSVIYGAGVGGSVYASSERNTSGASVYGGRAVSGGVYGRQTAAQGVVGKVVRQKRESFKPRPSIDALEFGHSHGVQTGGGRWDGGFTVREEDEY